MARKALYKHAKVVTVPDDGTSPVGSDEWNANPDAQGMLGFSPASATVTIASGVATVTDTITVVAAESSTSDTLDKLAITNTSQYDLIYLFADSGDNITLTNTSSPSVDGQIKTVSGSDETLSTTVPTILIRKGNFWYGYGGGVVNAVSDIGDVTISAIGSGELLKWNGSAWINQTLAEAGIQGTLSNANIATAVEAASDSNTFTDADHSKLNAIAASANNYVHPNHSGEVTSTADGATVIADNVVTLAKMAGLARGKIIVGDASGNPSALAAGANDTVLTMDASGDVGWEAPSGGGAHTEQDFTVQSGHATDPSSGTATLYVKTIDSNNEGLFIKMKKNGNIQFVQVG